VTMAYCIFETSLAFVTHCIHKWPTFWQDVVLEDSCEKINVLKTGQPLYRRQTEIDSIAL